MTRALAFVPPCARGGVQTPRTIDLERAQGRGQGRSLHLHLHLLWHAPGNS